MHCKFTIGLKIKLNKSNRHGISSNLQIILLCNKHLAATNDRHGISSNLVEITLQNFYRTPSWRRQVKEELLRWLAAPGDTEAQHSTTASPVVHRELHAAKKSSAGRQVQPGTALPLAAFLSWWPSSPGAATTDERALLTLLADGRAGATRNTRGGKRKRRRCDNDKLTQITEGGKRKWKNQGAGALFSYKLKVEKDIPLYGEKGKNQTVRTALTTLLLSHHPVPRVTVATKCTPDAIVF